MDITKQLTGATVLLLAASNANAIALYGAYARGQDFAEGGAENGGVGFSSASVSSAVYAADTTLSGSSYTPVLRAESVSVSPENSDDFTTARAESYQTFFSSITQTITLNLNFHGVVSDDISTSSYVLADVKIRGGATHMVSDTYCSNGDYAFANNVVGFGAYLCGNNLGTSNLFIPDGDVTLTDTITFDIGAGESFSVYGILRANSFGGSADAFHTLQMNFDDDTYLTAASSVVPLPAAFWLFGSGLFALLGLGRCRQSRQ